jgi:heme-degrading monooxygenase HmoA
MIARSWRGYAALAEREVYPRHLLHTVRPKLEQLPGVRGLYLFRRNHPQEVEFLVLTLWDSMDAVRKFAGEQPEVAVVEPEARAALVRYDALVSHYEVMASPGL